VLFQLCLALIAQNISLKEEAVEFSFLTALYLNFFFIGLLLIFLSLAHDVKIALLGRFVSAGLLSK